MLCSSGLYFDPITYNCNWPWDTQCNGRPVFWNIFIETKTFCNKWHVCILSEWLYKETRITNNHKNRTVLNISCLGNIEEYLHCWLRISGSVPTGLLVQEPNVAAPQKAVQESDENAGVGFSVSGMWDRFTIGHIWFDKFISVFTTRIDSTFIIKDPIFHMCCWLEAKEAICPGRGRGKPDEGQNCGNYEVNLRITFLFICVQVGIEDIQSQTEIENMCNIDRHHRGHLRGKTVKPS